MRKFLILLLLLVATQLNGGSNSYTVIVELQPNANSQAIAAAFGGTVLASIEGTSGLSVETSGTGGASLEPGAGYPIGRVERSRPAPAAIRDASSRNRAGPRLYSDLGQLCRGQVPLPLGLW